MQGFTGRKKDQAKQKKKPHKLNAKIFHRKKIKIRFNSDKSWLAIASDLKYPGKFISICFFHSQANQISFNQVEAVNNFPQIISGVIFFINKLIPMDDFDLKI